MVGISLAIRRDSKTLKESLVSRLSGLNSRLGKGDSDFMIDLLTGIVYTTCNGARLSGWEKEYREWKIPTRDFIRFNRVLSGMGEEDRKTVTALVLEAEEYGTRLAEEALAKSIHVYFGVLSGAKRTFRTSLPGDSGE